MLIIKPALRPVTCASDRPDRPAAQRRFPRPPFLGSQLAATRHFLGCNSEQRDGRGAQVGHGEGRQGGPYALRLPPGFASPADPQTPSSGVLWRLHSRREERTDSPSPRRLGDRSLPPSNHKLVLLTATPHSEVGSTWHLINSAREACSRSTHKKSQGFGEL